MAFYFLIFIKAMKFNLNINQVFCQKYNLTFQEGAVMDIMSHLSSWASGKEIAGEIYYYFSAKKMCEELPILALKERSMLAVVKKLKDKGLLDHIILDNKGYYRVTDIWRGFLFFDLEGMQNNVEGCSEMQGGMQNNAHKGAEKCTPGMQNNAHNNNTIYNNTNNITNNKKNKQKKDFFVEVDNLQISENLKQVLKDFLEHRNEIKKPMTEKAFEIILKNIFKHTETEVISVISASIENWWQGLFWDRYTGTMSKKNVRTPTNALISNLETKPEQEQKKAGDTETYIDEDGFTRHATLHCPIFSSWEENKRWEAVQAEKEEKARKEMETKTGGEITFSVTYFDANGNEVPYWR